MGSFGFLYHDVPASPNIVMDHTSRPSDGKGPSAASHYAVPCKLKKKKIQKITGPGSNYGLISDSIQNVFSSSATSSGERFAAGESPLFTDYSREKILSSFARQEPEMREQ